MAAVVRRARQHGDRLRAPGRAREGARKRSEPRRCARPLRRHRRRRPRQGGRDRPGMPRTPSRSRGRGRRGCRVMSDAEPTLRERTASMSPQGKSAVRIDGRSMAFVSKGTGDPIVLLHGNPTSSYVWRHVIDEVAAHGRCFAPDLLGMGDSEKLADSGPTSCTLVRHPDAVRGIAYLEGIVAPMTWADLPPLAVELFKALRSPAGEQMILEQNMFIEALLPSGVSKVLEPDVLDEYRRPYLQEGESRRPTLSWARQIPLDGEPAEVDRIVRQYSSWMARNDIPKLFINGDPGMVLVGRARDLCRTWPNQTEVTVPGLHFLQEDSGQKIGHAIGEWLRTIVGALNGNRADALSVAISRPRSQ